ncbi:hypothetical protein EDB89DRAFT_2246972 [Lactarius sanguifluus]|nr:hypothetical protein EDB89DRAFT_2246972 [Lactarius sanguifluus]
MRGARHAGRFTTIDGTKTRFSCPASPLNNCLNGSLLRKGVQMLGLREFKRELPSVIALARSLALSCWSLIFIPGTNPLYYPWHASERERTTIKNRVYLPNSEPRLLSAKRTKPLRSPWSYSNVHTDCSVASRGSNHLAPVSAARRGLGPVLLKARISGQTLAIYRGTLASEVVHQSAHAPPLAGTFDPNQVHNLVEIEKYYVSNRLCVGLRRALAIGRWNRFTVKAVEHAQAELNAGRYDDEIYRHTLREFPEFATEPHTSPLLSMIIPPSAPLPLIPVQRVIRDRNHQRYRKLHCPPENLRPFHVHIHRDIGDESADVDTATTDGVPVAAALIPGALTTSAPNPVNMKMFSSSSNPPTGHRDKAQDTCSSNESAFPARQMPSHRSEEAKVGNVQAGVVHLRAAPPRANRDSRQ